MTVLIVGLYCAAAYFTFKVFRIKFRPVPVAVAAMGGVLLIAAIIILWKAGAPNTKQLTLTRYVVQIVSEVRGPIKKIYCKPAELVKKGTLLLEVDPEPFQDQADQCVAELAAANENVSELEAGVAAAAARVKQAEATEAQVKISLDTSLAIQKDNPQAVAQLKVDEAVQKYRGAQAGVEEARAAHDQARFALASARQQVKSSEAKLDEARYMLRMCKYLAPADGYVMNWQVREETMATSQLGTFMDMSATEVLAVFPQNQLHNVRPGDLAEVAFRNTPGRVWPARVDGIVEYTGEGQLTPEGKLPTAASIGSQGFLVVKLHLDDQEGAKTLPLGAAGAAAIYTSALKPVHVLSKIVLHINSWSYYLLPI